MGSLNDILKQIKSNKNIIITIVAAIILLLCIAIFHDKSPVEEITINKVEKSQFTIYKQKSDKSGYDKSDDVSFPLDYKYNETKSYCLDNKGNKLTGVLTYSDNKATVTSNKTVYCTLYFDYINSLRREIATKAAETNPLVQEYQGTGWVGETNQADRFFTNHIYYWMVPSGTYGGQTAVQNAATIRNSWNVVFAGHCWQMIRTTESGGVKLLYNGEPDIDGSNYDCSDSRNLYHMGEIDKQYNSSGSETTYNISGSKVYTDSFTATTSGTTTTFTLVNTNGTTPTSKSISSSNASEVVGMYTCGTTSTTCTNANLRKIVSIKTGTTAVINISTYRDSIGSSPFNSSSNSPAYVGYMYNDHTASISKPLVQNIGGAGISPSISKSFGTGTYFSDTAPTWNSTNNYYNALTSSKTAATIKTESGLSDYSALVGKYTFGSSSSSGTSSFLYYVVGVSGTTMYLRGAVGGAMPSTANTTTYTIGTSITDNKNGTYTITGTNNYDITTWTASTISPSASNYYYMCGDGVSTTCSYGDARFIYYNSATSISLYYMLNGTYGTYKIGTQLSYNSNDDTYTLGGTTSDVLPINFYRIYSSINNKFMCLSGDATCSKANTYYNASTTNIAIYAYSPNYNYKLTNSYSYNSGTYTLNMSDENAIETWNDFYTSSGNTPIFSTLPTKMGKAHYVCLDGSNNPAPNTTSCSNVGYIYYYSVPTVYFMKLSGGQYINTNIDNVSYQEDNNLLWKMLYASNVNTIDSTIKTNVDKWYEANILNTSAESKIDNNEIYCIDRSTSNSFGSWNLNASNTTTDLIFSGLRYKPRQINSTNFNEYNLSCPRKTDAYSKNETAKGNGALTYAIGLISYPEIYNISSNNARINSNYSWLASPAKFSISTPGAWSLSTSGGFNNSSSVNNYAYSIRPAIALKSDVEFSRGDGSFTNPYIVE